MLGFSEYNASALADHRYYLCFPFGISGGCSTYWYKIYEHDVNGKMISGNKGDLIREVKSGAAVRVLSNNNYLTSIQNAVFVGDDLCAQALFHVGREDYNRFQVWIVFLFYMFLYIMLLFI